MPYVNIKITREGATAEQKAKLIEGATQLLVDVLGKNPATSENPGSVCLRIENVKDRHEIQARHDDKQGFTNFRPCEFFDGCTTFNLYRY